MPYLTTLSKEEEVRFFLRSSNRNERAFYILSGILFATGIFLIVIPQSPNPLTDPNQYYGFGLIGFAILILLILFSQSLSHKSYYSVGPNVLVLQKGFSRRTIKIKNIVELKILNEQEAVSELVKYQEQERQTRSHLDSLDSFRAQRKLGKFITYCTAPVSYQERTAGRYEPVASNQNMHGTGEFVLLKSKTGTQLLLSPKDCRGFIKEIEKYRVSLNKQ